MLEWLMLLIGTQLSCGMACCLPCRGFSDPLIVFHKLLDGPSDAGPADTLTHCFHTPPVACKDEQVTLHRCGLLAESG